MPKRTELRHIVRHHDAGQSGLGWRVCVKRREKVYEEEFTDAMHGSKEKALEAAKRFRDVCLAELPPAAPIKFRNSKNKTGVIGVSYIKADDRYGKRERFVATWPTKKGKPIGRSFSVSKYGYEGAFELAKAAREENILREFGAEAVSPVSPDPKPLIEEVGGRLGIKEKRTGFLGVLRIDAAGEERQGWEVGVRRGKRYIRYFFPDARYGSKTKAMKAAKQYQNARRDGEAFPAPVRFRYKKNKTGVVGVALMRIKRAGEVVEAYRAKWPTRAGKEAFRWFFVSKYGRDRAFELARQAREEGIVNEFGRAAVSPRIPAPRLTAEEGGLRHRGKMKQNTRQRS